MSENLLDEITNVNGKPREDIESMLDVLFIMLRKCVSTCLLSLYVLLITDVGKALGTIRKRLIQCSGMIVDIYDAIVLRVIYRRRSRQLSANVDIKDRICPVTPFVTI